MDKHMRWILATGIGLTSGCLQAEGEIPEVCLRQENVWFDPSAFVSEELIPDAGLGYTDLGDVSDGAFLDETELTEQAEQLLDGQLAVEQSFAFESTEELDFLTGEQLNAEARFRRIRLTLVRESRDSFDFVDSFAVLVRPLDPASQLPEVELIRCAGSQTCDLQSAEIVQDSASGIDMVPYIQQGDIEFLLRFEGTLPTEGWSVDVDACLSATVNARVF